MVTFKEFIVEGGQVSERQETALVSLIKKYAKNGPINVQGIKNVVDANKMPGINVLGTEPYTDVVLTTKSGPVNLSLKGGTEAGVSQAPSVAGGGMAGLQTLIPDVIGKFLTKANSWYKKQGYKKGDQIPDIYGQLNPEYTNLVLTGTKEMGGPVHFIYVGPMDVTVKSFENNKLTLNGVFHNVKEYAKAHPIYFRLRKRRNDQPYEPDLKDAEGFPLILGKSPTKGDSGRRIVMVPSIPKQANVVSI
jgi:hypothetical protein